MNSFALGLCVCLALGDASALDGRRAADDSVRERAWKVTLTGGAVAALGAGFAVWGSVLLAGQPQGTALADATSLQVGGVLLGLGGVLIALVSVPMFAWLPREVSPRVALSPFGVSLTW